MKRLWIPTLSMALILACSAANVSFSVLGATATLPPAPTPARPTDTSTLPASPTHTFTPTLIGLQTAFAPSASTPASATGSPIPPGVPTAKPSASTGPSLEGSGFDAIRLSTQEFHWAPCEPSTASVTATVTDAAKVLSVVLFVRILDKDTGQLGHWDEGTAMDPLGGETLGRTFDGKTMGIYDDSWIEYQLVGTDTTSSIVARSLVYVNSLTLSRCP